MEDLLYTYNGPSPWDNYPFAWLDELVEVKLNPSSVLFISLKEDDLGPLYGRVNAEVGHIWLSLKRQVFEQVAIPKRTLIVDRYSGSIDYLINMIEHNRQVLARDDYALLVLEKILPLLLELKTRIFHRYAHDPPGPVNQKVRPLLNSVKLTFNLSGDQIGILLRAADDTKLVLARSISAVFKNIVPYLSSTRRKDLSWDSVRSNSQHPEASDKKIVLEVLQKMIDKISGYD